MAEADVEDVEKAVKAARKAFEEGPWPRMWAAADSPMMCMLLLHKLCSWVIFY